MGGIFAVWNFPGTKSTIGFRRSHVVLSYEGLKLQEKIYRFVKKNIRKIKKILVQLLT